MFKKIQLVAANYVTNKPNSQNLEAALRIDIIKKLIMYMTEHM